MDIDYRRQQRQEGQCFLPDLGDETKTSKPVLIHGFPNSSFDYYKMIPFLEDEYHIATLDFPGSGFSDKPLDGYNYMLAENADLLIFLFARSSWV